MTADTFRKQALAIPGSVELEHGGHPDFRLNGRVFASLGAPSEEWGMVKLTPEQQAAFMARGPKVFHPCPGAWGRQGYTNVLLAPASVTTLRPALAAAAENMTRPAPKRH